MSKKVIFHSYQLGERGTEVAMYKYAKYNEEILGNKSIILSTSSRPTPSLELFKTRFPVILYKNEWKNDGKNDELRNLFEYICDEEKIDLFYAIKGGENDGILPTNTRSAAHAVFRTDQPHGTVYAGICEYICKKFNNNNNNNNHPFVYHIIEEEAPHITSDLRDYLDIPDDALVFGRHGGKDTFSLQFVKDAIKEILNIRKDIYFVFLNTDKFIQHERVKYLPYTSSFEEKARFVNTCDAMIHARYDGEIFSVSIPEFSTKNKPVFTWKPDIIPAHYDTGHLYVLQDRGIYYKDKEDLLYLLKGVSKDFIETMTWDAYGDTYSPKNVMDQFNKVFL